MRSGEMSAGEPASAVEKNTAAIQRDRGLSRGLARPCCVPTATSSCSILGSVDRTDTLAEILELLAFGHQESLAVLDDRLLILSGQLTTRKLLQRL